MEYLPQLLFRVVLGIIALFILGDVLRGVDNPVIVTGLQLLSLLLLGWALEVAYKAFREVAPF